MHIPSFCHSYWFNTKQSTSSPFLCTKRLQVYLEHKRTLMSIKDEHGVVPLLPGHLFMKVTTENTLVLVV